MRYWTTLLAASFASTLLVGVLMWLLANYFGWSEEATILISMLGGGAATLTSALIIGLKLDDKH